MNPLRVWHIPQIPGKSFTVEVANLVEAKLLLDVFARYDDFQFKHNIKPDYSNASGVQENDPEEGGSIGILMMRLQVLLTRSFRPSPTTILLTPYHLSKYVKCKRS